MSNTPPHALPKDWLPGLIENWRNDLIAAFSVALVALPLGLGIAIAAGVPPMAGLIAAMVGGLVTTFIRGGTVSINGPPASLIIVMVAAMSSLGDYRHLLGVFVVAGILQVLFGVFKLGKLRDFFPSSVIHGMLAAIGVIIMSQQIHVAMGGKSAADSTFGILLDIPNKMFSLNPIVTLVSVLSLAILLLHPRIKNKMIHFIPAPMFVLALSIPLVLIFDFLNPHTVNLFGNGYHIGPDLLLDVPSQLQASILFPSFAKIGEPAFWTAVIGINLVATIETLLGAAAVDKLDPFNRKTDLNRDLIGVGLSTVLSACIGGLPIIAVIVRSSVNINHGGKTRWANFFHGLLILAFVLLFASYLSLIPLAALAAILIFTGYKLASPKSLTDAYRKGPEQFFILASTLYLILSQGLIEGILAGIGITLMTHLVLSRMPLKLFLKNQFKPKVQIFSESTERYLIKVQGLLNFGNVLNLIKHLEKLPAQSDLDLDLSHTYLVDHTTMEFLDDYREKYESSGGSFDVIGLDLHQSASHHPHALRVHVPPHQLYTLTRRQQQLEAMCESHQWRFEAPILWGATRNIRQFQFFDTRPIEFRNNLIHGHYQDLDLKWEVADVTFDEGAMNAKEVYRTTVQIIELPDKQLPPFTMEQEELMDKILSISGFEDVDFKTYTNFSSRFVIKGLDEKALRAFFTPKILAFFEKEKIYHLESNGHALFIFKYLRLATPQRIEEMVRYSERLVRKLHAATAALSAPVSLRSEPSITGDPEFPVQPDRV